MQFEVAKAYVIDRLRKELPAKLVYHSLWHTEDICDSCRDIAHHEQVTGDDLILLQTAALFHDIGHLNTTKQHEIASCDIAREQLPRFGYTDIQIDRICGMIMATMIPQTANNILEMIICDADLDYLGRDDFFILSHYLYSEILRAGTVTGKNEWNKLQVAFMESHRYLTNTSIKRRSAKKEEHLAIIKSLIVP